MTTLDLSLKVALARCLGVGCDHVGRGGKCEYHTRLDRAGLPCRASTINRRVYRPKTAGGKPIKMDAPAVFITQVIECAEKGAVE
jgi:hypothetical protein